MTAPVFVDTNVLVYARDSRVGSKQEAAQTWIEHLWKSQSGRLSFQVLSEYYVTVTTKLRPGMAVEAARREVRDLLAWRPVPLDGTLMDSAWLLQDRYRLSWWDSLIVSAAQAADCGVLLSEDFQEGQDLDGVRIVNPFTTSPAELTT